MTNPNDKLRLALKKDFDKLYVKEFTTNWEAERFIRGVEIGIMGLDNLEALFAHHLLEYRDRLVETEKAYGGCHKCYGKGYATVRKGETYHGATHNLRTQINYCSCDRGKQLKALLERSQP
jgi:hypothetical protein